MEGRDDTSAKRMREQRLVAEMIALYCRGNHAASADVVAGSGLCPECDELASYARARSERCPRMQEKTFCSACPRPCYKPEMRERIRVVMQYAGPRMLLRHPVMVVRHGIETMRQRRAR